MWYRYHDIAWHTMWIYSMIMHWQVHILFHEWDLLCSWIPILKFIFFKIQLCNASSLAYNSVNHETIHVSLWHNWVMKKPYGVIQAINHSHIRTYFTHTHACTHTRACTCTCMLRYTHAHTRAHTCAHTHTHIIFTALYYMYFRVRVKI